MVKHSYLKPGDRVELAWGVYNGPNGTVEYISDSHVRVCWDDGTTGLLYWDDKTPAQAKYLIKLRPLRK